MKHLEAAKEVVQVLHQIIMEFFAKLAHLYPQKILATRNWTRNYYDA